VQETAINIGFACSLLRNDMTQYIISANLPEVLALEEAGKVDEAYTLAHSKIGEQLQDALQCMAEAKAGTMPSSSMAKPCCMPWPLTSRGSCCRWVRLTQLHPSH